MKNCCTNNNQNYKKIEESAELLKAVAEPNRLRILCALSKEKICVCDLAESLEIPQNLLSFHLKTLYEAGILKKQRDGNNIYYLIKKDWNERIEKIFEFLGIK